MIKKLFQKIKSLITPTKKGKSVPNVPEPKLWVLDDEFKGWRT